MPKSTLPSVIPKPPKPILPVAGKVDVMAGPPPMKTTPAFKGPAWCVNQTGLGMGLNR